MAVSEVSRVPVLLQFDPPLKCCVSGASRDRRNDVEEDQRSKCFICSQETSKFERLGRGFAYHVKHEHNMWMYIYMTAYLLLKVRWFGARGRVLRGGC